MKNYVIYYNGQAVADFQTLKSVQNHIDRKGYKNDNNNLLDIYDNTEQKYLSI